MIVSHGSNGEFDLSKEEMKNLLLEWNSDSKTFFTKIALSRHDPTNGTISGGDLIRVTF